MIKYILLCVGVTISTLIGAQHLENRNYSRLVQKTEKQLDRTEKKVHRTLKKAHLSKSPLGKPQSNRRSNDILSLANTPDQFWKQEWIATMNPSLGRPTPELLYEEMLKQQRQLTSRAMPGTTKTTWSSRGPNNLAGRTRALAVDPTVKSGKKIWAGAVTGGLWYNNDITSSTSAWQFVSSIWSNITVTCIAFDPNAPGTMYIGTGEGWGSTSSTSRGFGIFKSIDSGKTFTQLASSKSYLYINDMVVRSEAGKSVLYVATDMQFANGSWHGTGTAGLMKSTNGGTSFSNIMPKIPSSTAFMIPADLELGADNRLWVGTRRNYAQTATDKGGGRVLYTDDGVNFTTAYTHADKAGRVELACAPSSAVTIYAVFESNGKVDTLLKSTNKGSTWSAIKKPKDADAGIPATDPSRGQAWYDLILAVSPLDSSDVMFGAIDLFLSENAGGSFTQVGKWSDNSGLANLSCSYVHADQHNVVFIPGSNACLIGNDGGVFYAPDILDNMSYQSVIYERNNGYIVTQFYWGDLSQTKGSQLMLAGAQDNGTHQLNSTGLVNENMVSGGDGGYCFISQSNDNKQVVSYVYNQFFATTNNWTSAAKLLDDPATGKFINPACWDDVNGFLFAGKGKCTLYRNKIGSAATSAQTLTISSTTANGAPSAFCSSVSSTGKAQLYVGTDVGKLYVSTDAGATTPVWTDITGTINAGNISSIFRLRKSDTLFVTISNYGTGVNIYMSVDAGKNWTSRDGNISDMPIWSILLNPKKMGEAIIATELGVYGTSDIFATSVVWTPYNEGMGAVKTSNLRYRENDQTIMVVTHGRGVFTSDAWSKASPIAKFGTSKDTLCSHQSVSLIDSSLNTPTYWRWSFTPSLGVKFLSGTDSSSKTPVVQFTKGGAYTIKLVAGNAIGDDTKTMVNRIFVIDSIPVSVTIQSNPAIVCVNDTFNITSSVLSNGKLIDMSYIWKKNGSAMSSIQKNLYGLNPLGTDKYQLVVSSKTVCVTPNPVNSNILGVQTRGVKTISVSCNLDTLKAANVGTGTYNWYKNGVLVGSGRLFKPSTIGIYRCLYVENGCKSDSSALIVLKSLRNSNVKDHYTVIYPNPVSDVLTIQIRESSCIRIYNSAGRNVFQNCQGQIGQQMSNVKKIDVKDWATGTYEVAIYNSSNDLIHRESIIVMD